MTILMRHTRASFRGVEFDIEMSERNIGYNFAMHVFPGSERRAVAEELSEAPETIFIDAFLLGRDAKYTRDLLLDACKDRNPGRLYHPELGYLMAKCKAFRTREILSKVGKIYLSLEFLEVPKGEEDTSTVFDLQKRIQKIDKMINNVALDLCDTLSTLSLPAYALTEVAKLLSKTGSFIHSDNGLNRVPATIYAASSATKNAESRFAELLKAPEELAKSLISSLQRAEIKYLIVLSNSKEYRASTKPKSYAESIEMKVHSAVSLATCRLSSLMLISRIFKTVEANESIRLHPDEMTAIKHIARTSPGELTNLEKSLAEQMETSRTKAQDQDHRPHLVIDYENRRRS